MTTPTNPDEVKVTLKPCPFGCEGEPVMIHPMGEWSTAHATPGHAGGYGPDGSRITCPKCSCCGDAFYGPDQDAQAIAFWNTRQASQPLEPQGEAVASPWHTVALDKALSAVIKAANDLCFAAETACGTAGRDAHLCAAIAHYAAERDKQQKVAKIVRFEWDEPEVGAGRLDHPLRAAHPQPQAGGEELEICPDCNGAGGDNNTEENDTPKARLEMVRVVLQAIVNGGDAIPLAKAGIDFCDLTQAEREQMRGEL